MARKRKNKTTCFPTRQQLLAYIQDSKGNITKRNIAKAFQIRGKHNRQQLDFLLQELEKEGLIPSAALFGSQTTKLPAVTTIKIIELNQHGEAIAIPTKWDNSAKRQPPYIVITDAITGQTPKLGDTALAKLTPVSLHKYHAKILRILPKKTTEKILGVYQKTGKYDLIEPVNRKQKQQFIVNNSARINAKTGDLVMAEIIADSTSNKSANSEAKIIEILGDSNNPNTYSLIAIHHHDIEVDFSAEAIKQAEDSPQPFFDAKQRIDLRDIPLITIDGSDARDFDDAVWAEPTKNGWHLLVAIADVAFYVSPNSALDKEAMARGNSTYFPDRVVPMLPEALSNGLCSLNPDEDRYCLAVHLWIDKNGITKKYKFVRGIMRSHARLTYEQAQTIQDSATNHPLKQRLKPMYEAYTALAKYKQQRGSLELNIPEYEIILHNNGAVERIRKRKRLDSHKLIEEFMIAANVAAADALLSNNLQAIFRIHEPPALDKIAELRNFLATMNHSLPAAPNAHHFNRLMHKTSHLPEAPLITTSILRSQMQAYYTPKNMGHFGLGLKQYCHFTSPIRRYADLVVHRALIAMIEQTQHKADIRLPDIDKLASIANHISSTERNSMSAEREAKDRYVTAYMATKQKAEFEGIITGIGNYGVFVTLHETGASGLIRIRDLQPRGYYIYEEKIHSLICRHSGQRFQLGQQVTVEIAEANTQLGSLRFYLVDAAELPEIPKYNTKHNKKHQKKQKHRKKRKHTKKRSNNKYK